VTYIAQNFAKILKYADKKRKYKISPLISNNIVLKSDHPVCVQDTMPAIRVYQ